MRHAPELQGAALVAIGLLAFMAQAEAAAFRLQESTVGLGTAFATARSAADSPATAFDNPAGMVQLPGLQIALGGTLFVPSFGFHGSGTTAFGTPVPAARTSEGGDVAATPYGYMTYKVSPDLAVGLSVTTPFGLSTSYGADFAGRYQGDKSVLETIDINPAVAYRLTPWLSVGAGLSAQHGRAVLTSFVNSSTLATIASQKASVLPDGYSHIAGDDWAFGYNAGILLQLGATTRVGLNYRSRVQQDFSGTADFTVPAPLRTNPAFRRSDTTATVVLPDSAGFGVTQTIGPSVTLHLDASWTNWSRLKTLTATRTDGTVLASTPEHYADAYFVAVGATYQWNERLVLRAGTAFDKTPVSDEYRTVRVPDQDRYWLAMGVSYRLFQGTTVDAGYAHVFAPPSHVRETSVTGDIVTGRYQYHVEIFSLGTRMQF